MLTLIDRGNATGLDCQRFWTLDPVDGTKGFLRGQQYAVCLALIVGGQVQLGVIGCPNLAAEDRTPGSLMFAVKGSGAFQVCIYLLLGVL